jgi:hypothetical protein
VQTLKQNEVRRKNAQLGQVIPPRRINLNRKTRRYSHCRIRGMLYGKAGVAKEDTG